MLICLRETFGIPKAKPNMTAQSTTAVKIQKQFPEWHPLSRI